MLLCCPWCQECLTCHHHLCCAALLPLPSPSCCPGMVALPCHCGLTWHVPSCIMHSILKSSPVWSFDPFLRQPNCNWSQNFWILLGLQPNQWQLVACSCIIGCNQLHTLKITRICAHMKYLLEMCQTRGFKSFLRILSTHIKNPCFVHFKDPLEMFKTRGCTIVYHQP